MFTQKTSARARSRLATALVALALTAAVLVLASQAISIRSTRIASQAPEAPAQSALIAKLQTSIPIPNGCRRRKFGCAQDATTTANSNLQTSIPIPKGCQRRKFGCGQVTTTIANRP